MIKKMSIHQRIKAGRERLKMTEQRFADAVGVSRGAVQQWEKPDGTAPKRKNQEAVAELLGITVGELMNPSDDEPGQAHTKPDVLGLSDDAIRIARLFDEVKGSRQRDLALIAAMQAIIGFSGSSKSLPSGKPSKAATAKKQRA